MYRYYIIHSTNLRTDSYVLMFIIIQSMDCYKVSMYLNKTSLAWHSENKPQKQ